MAAPAAQVIPLWKRINKASDFVLPFLIVGIVLMIIIPLPPVILDMLIICSMGISLISILITMYISTPLEFSVFPAVILFTTIFRLALNISTTRAILANADAGRIIDTFGAFVIGGNLFIGFVIFAIIVLVNFLVITHGAKRIGEVAARFTLDAMPGKQMSIDADLNNGLINEEQARQRRKDLEREADYFGAMDGASNFIQRDAIAGIIITLINIAAGLGIGILSKHWPASRALQTYVRLTVGDGLVSQIPALLMSTATGIMVTIAASETNLSGDLTKQVLARSEPLYVAVIVLLGMVFLSPFTGFPVAQPLIVAFMIGLFAYFRDRAKKRAMTESDEAAAMGLPPRGEAAAAAARTGEAVSALLHVDPMELEIGYGLIPLVDPDQKGDLLDRVTMIRRQTALELGMVVPPIRIRDNIQLRPNEYVIKIKGVEVARGTLLVDHYLAMNPGTASDEIKGIETTEPAFGLPALWITEEKREEAEMLGYTVVDPASVVATHLTEILKTYGYELLGRQEVKTLIDNVQERYPAVVEELIPNTMTVGEVQKILQNLLRERISIRDLVTILETIADYASMTKDSDVLTEYARAALARQICYNHRMPDGTVPVITLDPKIEEVIANSIQKSEVASYPVLPPDIMQSILDALAQAVEKSVRMNYQPIILCSPRVRIYFRRLIERLYPSLSVLSHSEITPETKVKSIGMVRIGEPVAG